MLKRIVLLGLLLTVAASAQQLGLDPPAPGIDWMYKLVNRVYQFTTSTHGVLMPLGWLEFAAFVLFGLFGRCFRMLAYSMNVGGAHFYLPLGDFYLFIVKVLFGSLMLSFYDHPLPGTNLFLYQVPAFFALMITKTIDHSLVKSLLETTGYILKHLERPSALNFLGALEFIFVVVDMSLISIAAFVLNAGAYVAIGILTMFGPIMIPLYVTARGESSFWRWFNALVGYSMYRPVAAGFVAVFAGVLLDFFTGTVNGDFSLGLWMAMLPTLWMLIAAMLYSLFWIVPRMVHDVFGSAGQMASGWVGDMTRGAAALLAA